MDELDFALETVDGTPFEELAASFLREKGYDVKESDIYGTDGGWDAFVESGDRDGVAHASTQERWKRKLRSDAESASELEDDRDEDFDIFLYTTNQRVSGTEELDFEEEIREDFGWNLILFHRQNLLGVLRDTSELAKQHLGVDLGFDREHLEDLENLRDERIEMIQDRSGPAEILQDGTSVTVHVIPNSIFSHPRVKDLDKLPDPRVLGTIRPIKRAESRGKYKHNTLNESLEEWRGYSLLRNDGLFESSSQNFVIAKENGNTFFRTKTSRHGAELTHGLFITIGDALSSILQIGYSGTATMWISLQDVEGVELDTATGGGRRTEFDFEVDEYITERVTIPIEEMDYSEVISQASHAVEEIWREAGHLGGCPYLEDGKWTAGSINVGDWSFP